MEVSNMKFLLDCGIPKDTINKIINNNSKQIIYDAEWNMEKVVSSIDYLKEIGIININGILIDRFDIFLRGRKKLEEKFNKLSNKNIIEQINNDYKNISVIDEL